MRRRQTGAVVDAPAEPLVRALGRVDYQTTLDEMRAFTDGRVAETQDEFWTLEHDPVLTLGQTGKREHLLTPGDIPVVQTDRGGQVTYHGPGQLIIYLMIDLRRLGITVRDLVDGIEQSVIALLDDYCIESVARRDAPGVYVDDRKIAALGLRVRRGRSYHGLSLNVDMDLKPFSTINPCGYQGLEVTQLCDLGVDESLSSVSSRLITHLVDQFGYSSRPQLKSGPAGAT